MDVLITPDGKKPKRGPYKKWKGPVVTFDKARALLRPGEAGYISDGTYRKANQAKKVK